MNKLFKFAFIDGTEKGDGTSNKLLATHTRRAARDPESKQRTSTIIYRYYTTLRDLEDYYLNKMNAFLHIKT